MDYLKNHKNNFNWQLPLKKWPSLVLVSLTILVGLLFGSIIWYFHGLSPASQSGDVITVDIQSGQSPHQIAKLLEQKSVIRSATVFKIYLRLTSRQNILKAGRYDFSANQTTPDIIKRLVDGSVSVLKVTFYPGSTLKDNASRPDDKKRDVASILGQAGFSEADIEWALNNDYDSPLFVDKPESADLEGYIFPETYQFNYGVSADQILRTVFAEFYKKLQENNLIEKYKARGLSLHQAITLASIIEKEAGFTNDHAQIAQVFYRRLALGMNLGSDVTYQYIADKTGVARDINIDSPYNTRRYGGLPPGPIASPSLKSLIAVAEPASGNYLYFLSGDDDVTYFTTNETEHINNIRKYCQIKCSRL